MSEIIVAEDVDFQRKKLTQLIENEGHDVRGVSDGKGAVEVFKEGNADLVLLDIVMNQMDGLEALKKIKEIDEDSNVIMVSGVSNKDTVKEALEEGAEEFLKKPVDEEKLKDVLQEY